MGRPDRRAPPDPADRHGPLPPVVLALTVVTGLVDAFGHLAPGHVLVANTTGNLVVSGFAIAGWTDPLWRRVRRRAPAPPPGPRGEHATRGGRGVQNG